MAKNSSGSTAAQSRWVIVVGGLLMGFLWGSLMWGLVTLFGQRSGGIEGWLYISLSMAMIGAGIAAIFGAFGARQRGERVAPRVRRSRDDDA